MMKQIAVTVCLTLSVASVSAQPKGVAADESQLGFFLGKWTVDGQSRSTPTGAYGRVTGNETCAWFSGGPSVVCRETTQDAGGEVDSIYILSYDPAKRQYGVHGTDNNGSITSGTGTVTAGVWKWAIESRAADGSVTPMRFTFRPAAPGSRTMDVEMASGKGTWAKIMGVTYKQTR
ncbi:MAG: DUF1579 family protein [Vicinamibacterales bacterium]